jgi:hypothetical protein
MACVNISGNILDISTNEQFLPLNESVDNGSYDIDALYNSLKNKGVIPSMPTGQNPSKDALHAYLKADAAMRANLKAGYEYYNARYKCAVERYLAADAAAKPAITTLQTLNNRLFVLLSLYQKIDASAGVKDSLNGVTVQKSLLEKISRGSAEEKEMYMRMIEYTKEKANVTNNLMQLYGFLNIVALGMLFYIYRST